MTLPDERYRAVMYARKFLIDISQHRSGLSDDIKQEARSILRHYPSEYDLDSAAEKAPFVFQKRMEPLYRMVKQYDLDKKEKEDDSSTNGG